jgi:hypothetical protein
MARKGFQALLCALVLIAPLPLSPRLAAEDHDGVIATTLAVQSALQQARDHMDRGDYGAAVRVLEAQLTRINGNREYLARLRDAYRGHIKELRLQNQDAEAQVYLKRLEILDPGARLDFDRKLPSAAEPIAAAPPPPPARPPALQPAAPKPEVTPTAAVTPAGPRAPLFRAKTAEDDRDAGRTSDPFSPGNVKQNPAPALLERARQEWDKRQYAAAGRFFEKAHEADPNSTNGCREEWGYCKISTIQQQLSQPSGDPLPYRQMEQEVRAAMAMAPQLKGKGEDLLAYIAQVRGGSPPATRGDDGSVSVAVRHVERSANGWAVAETANFRIFHNEGRDFAEKVARVAERTRVEVSRKWFGDGGESWDARCDVYLHATARDYSRATGKPAEWAAHSSIEAEGGRVVTRRIDLHCDHPDLLFASLPHETTHVVLAGRFGGPDLPRWADEGMAMLTEPRDKIDAYLRGLPRQRQDGLLFGVRELMTMTRYPDRQRAPAFYAQSLSLTQYLVNQRGPLAFSSFLNEAQRYGYDRALRNQYGCDFPTLEQRWRQAAFGGAATQTAYGGAGR